MFPSVLTKEKKRGLCFIFICFQLATDWRKSCWSICTVYSTIFLKLSWTCCCQSRKVLFFRYFFEISNVLESSLCNMFFPCLAWFADCFSALSMWTIVPCLPTILCADSIFIYNRFGVIVVTAAPNFSWVNYLVKVSIASRVTASWGCFYHELATWCRLKMNLVIF